MPKIPTTPGLIATAEHYAQSSSDFLKKLIPEISLELFSDITNVTSPILNALFEIVTQVFKVLTKKKYELVSNLLSVYNFYLRTQEYQSLNSLTVGFADMMNTIFGFDKLPNAYKIISETANTYFKSITSYFLKPEGLENTIKKFWEAADLKDPRSIINIVWELTSLSGTCFFVYDFYKVNISGKSLTQVISTMNEHLLKPHSDIRTRVKSASECVARVIDFIALNYVHMINGDFNKISWRLPAPLKFENDYSLFMSQYSSYKENPLFLEENNLKLCNLRDISSKLIEKANTLLSLSKQSADKNTLVRYLSELNRCLRVLEEDMNPNNTKPQPMSLVICGPAGCGKSSIATNIGKQMQTIANRSPDENKIKNRGGDPKFEPSITTSTEVIVEDDFANDTNAKIPPKRILDIINVTRECIPKASVEEKSRHKYSNIGTILTTNDPNLGVNQIATCSYESMLRRFNIVIFITVKEEFCIPGSNVLNRNHPHFANGTKADVYDIQLKTPRTVKCVGHVKTVVYDIIEHWRDERFCDLKNAMLFIEKKLRGDWNMSVQQHEDRNSPNRLCIKCSLEHLVCTCTEKETLKPEGYTDTLYAEYERFHKGFNLTTDSINSYMNFADMRFISLGEGILSTFTLSYFKIYCACLKAKGLYYFNKHSYWIVFSILLTMCCSFLNVGTVYFLSVLIASLIKYHFNNLLFWIFHCIFLVIVCIFAHFSPLLGGLLICISAPIIYYQQVSEEERHRLEEKHYRDCSWFRNAHYSRMAFYSVTCTSILFCVLHGISKCCKYIYSQEPEFRRDVANDPYMPTTTKTNSDDKARYHHKPKGANSAVTSSHAEAKALIAKKSLIVRVTDSFGNMTEVRGTPLGSCMLMPHHVIPNTPTFDVTICADYSKRTSAYHSKNLSSNHYVQLRSKTGQLVDAILLYFPNIPAQPDLSKYFSINAHRNRCAAIELYKQADGTCTEIELRLNTPGILTHIAYGENKKYDNYPAITCKSRDYTSENGMCGSLIMDANLNVVYGIHVAGNGTNNWLALRIDKDMIDVAMKESNILPQFLAQPCPEHFHVKNNLPGFQFDDESPTDAVNEIGITFSPLEEIGIVTKDDQMYCDRAEKHYFPNRNPNLVDAFGPVTSQPPVAPNGLRQINSTLEKLANPKFGVPADLADEAAEDYLNSNYCNINFSTIINELKQDKDFFTVRSTEQALRGDDTGIVGGINNASSAGWLYGGKKTKHYNMDVEGDPLERRELLPYMKADIESQEHEWRNGRSTYDPFKRCSKTNELLPLKKAEEKTRSFYGNDMTFFINMTRGIIPIKHVLRKNMELSECFVGITPQGKQWRKLMTYLTKDGVYLNLVGGDFSGYDTQLPKMLLDKAAYIIMQIARRGGMSETDLEFLRGSLSSVVSPTLLWQGHVLRAANGQPSGQPLTVEINSIVNSLLMRMVFKVIMIEHHPEHINTPFRDLVRLATYGDDNLMGVDSSIPAYNHTNIQEVFSRWGIKYTMADKDADSIPYQTIEEVSFLKRSFSLHPELGIVAPIEKESITKCFYWWTRPKNTPLNFQEQFESMVNAQQREAALWGKAYYEQWSESIHKLQEGSQLTQDDFTIAWNGYEIEPYDEMISILREAYLS